MTQALVIERNIPLPPRKANNGNVRDAITNALDALAVNESLALPSDVRWPYGRASNANVRLAPKRFAIRKVNREYRIWRTA